MKQKAKQCGAPGKNALKTVDSRPSYTLLIIIRFKYFRNRNIQRLKQYVSEMEETAAGC